MLIIPKKANQLANRLFLFAHVIACAIEHHTVVVNTAFAEYAANFYGTSLDLLCRYPRHEAPWTVSRAQRDIVARAMYRLAHSLTDGRLDWLQGQRVRVLHSGWETTLTDPSGLVDLQSDQFRPLLSKGIVVFLFGPLFRDFPAFRKHSDAIREYFAPLAGIRDNVDALMERVRYGSDLVIGVHIRQGDYRKFVDGRYFFSTRQYLDVMANVQRLFPKRRIRFLICSNVPQASDRFSDFDHALGHGGEIEDLYSLARCDLLIGVPSTYAAWASFYGRVPLYSISDPRKTSTLDDFVVNDG
jgi:hypothetical protein